MDDNEKSISEETLNQDVESDIVTGDDSPETAQNDRQPVRRLPILSFMIVSIMVVLMAVGTVVYHSRISDSFSEAVRNLFAARSGKGTERDAPREPVEG
ncbi:MAG: hypothetical protein PHU03_08670, partial [Syntrophales bacterium]|nr:hypothetical protein [Syntrophales bacterium]